MDNLFDLTRPSLLQLFKKNAPIPFRMYANKKINKLNSEIISLKNLLETAPENEKSGINSQINKLSDELKLYKIDD